jgi:uncharacterized membrane protein
MPHGILSSLHGTARFLSLVLLTSSLACGPSGTSRTDDTARTGPDSVSTNVETHPTQSQGSSPWEDARRRGIDFRAIGQEPGWLLEIDAGKSMYLLADYGEKKVTTLAPAPTRDSTGATTYAASADGHHLTVVIRERACQDAMSGEEMTHEATVTLDGREYRGCGRQLGDRGIGG